MPRDLGLRPAARARGSAPEEIDREQACTSTEERHHEEAGTVRQESWEVERPGSRTGIQAGRDDREHVSGRTGSQDAPGGAGRIHARKYTEAG